MQKKIMMLLVAFTIVIIGISAVSAEDDAIYQVSLLQAFMHGEYDGVISVGDLRSHGDTGLGTFDGANGEMIVLDGVVYQAKADGTIHIMEDNETVPFATVTEFDEDEVISEISANNFTDLTNQLDSKIAKDGVNNIYVVKINGNFSNITVRSVEKQQKPYKEFTEVAKTDQRVFNYTNQSGTLVAVYFPEYMGELNMHGWHLHFISDDKTKGGHVLELNLVNGSGGIDIIHDFNMILPESGSFSNMSFSENMTGKIASVE